MRFTNFLYVDPEIAVAGDGSTPALALDDLPAYDSLTDDCLYIIKRTSYPVVDGSTRVLAAPRNMTANTTGEWTVSAYAVYSSYQAYNAFDGKTESHWHSPSDGYGSPKWIQWQNTVAPKVLRRYWFDTYRDYYPTAWTLKASNDGETWTTLDTRSSISWGTYMQQSQEFYVDNDIAYSYYRLEFTAGNSGYMAIYSIGASDEAEPDDYSYCNWIQCGSRRTGITKIGFMGAPQIDDADYQLLPVAEQEKLDTAGWSTSSHRYANIRSGAPNNVYFSYSTVRVFYMRNINMMRDETIVDFNQAPDNDSGRYLIYLTSGCSDMDIRGCRFSVSRFDLDNENYFNWVPTHKACAYIRVTGGANITFEDNVVNYLGQTYSSSGNHCYDGFCFLGGGRFASICRNKIYYSNCNSITMISGTTGTTNHQPRRLFYFDNNDWVNTKINDNEIIFRASDYKNMPSLFYFPYHRYFEFRNNYLHSGVHMDDYDFTRMKCRQHAQSVFNFSVNEMTYCYDYCITDNRIYMPETWNVYGCYIFEFNGRNQTSYRSSEGMFWAHGQKKFENFELILGEGPSVSEIHADDLSIINSQRGTGTLPFNGNAAFYFSGNTVWESYGYYHHSNQANSISGLKIYHPWGIAARLRSGYFQCPEIRGGIIMNAASYIVIDTMTIKAPFSKSIYNDDSGNLVVKELFVEDTSASNMFGASSTRFAIQIDKSNVPIRDNTESMWSTSGYYNESFILHKDIGEDHRFMYRTLNRYVESCNARRNGTNTLKLFGTAARTEDYPLAIMGSDGVGVSSRALPRGKYIVRVHSAFYGSDLLENTITTPSSDQKNVYRYYRTAIKTNWGVYGARLGLSDKTTVASVDSDWEWTYVLNPFYEEFEFELEEESPVHLMIECFSVNSTGFDLSNPSAAVFLDPNIEIVWTNNEDSNSASQSAST